MKIELGRETPILFMMFAIVLLSLIIIGIASYWDTESWTWIAQQNASLVLVLIVLGLAMFVLVGWLRGKR